jgi:two-component system, OmpR family, response regulator
MTLAEKILIVEDDAIIATFLSRTLKSHGYDVTQTRKGKDAFEKVNTIHYNLVLLDIGLPDMTGTDLLKMIRETDNDLIVLMITGRPSLDTSIDSVNYGADGYLIKPIREKELVDIVEEKLKQRFSRLVNSKII